MKRSCVRISVLLAFMALTAIANAQTATATLKGVVSDAGGGAVPGAVVTLTNAATNLKKSFTTDEGGHFTFTTNLSLQRDFNFTENARLQIRAEAFNVFNRANFQIPGTTLGASSFGVITGAEDPRQVQFAARIYF